MRKHSWFVLATLFAVVTVSSCTCQRRSVVETPIPELLSCPADERCESGLCDAVPTGDGSKVCLRPCTQGCRGSDICTKLEGDRYACVPEKAGLCKACVKDGDCPQPADRCIVLGDSSFCGRDCSFDDSCPSSYRCADATAANGAPAPKQCQPSSGTCDCIAATAGQQRPCQATNNLGTCNGVEVCNPPEGYSACSARTPTNEVCNGIDDDCNGMTDENLGDLTCGVGECVRSAAACANGAPQTCTPGAAIAETCNGRDDDCDGTVDNGFSLDTNPNNCGSCGRVCVLTNAVAGCAMGGCTIDRCTPGWSDLDHVAANGCEYPCVPTDGGVEVCDGLDNDCNGVVDDNFNLISDPLNCGQCNLACSLPQGQVQTYQCTARVCGIATCVPGRGDCNQQYGDGCEVDTTTSLLHCGGCGMNCVTPNATPQCSGGMCGIAACVPGFANCNGQLGDGCEVDTTTSLNNCGSCGTTCSAANASSTCTAGLCRFTCAANWWDADGQAANGCEYACIRSNGGVEQCDGIDNDCDNRIDEDFDLTSNAQHCGACNRACSAPSASVACTNSACGITACNPGRANCNAQYPDGCEVNTATDLNNCGGCGTVCSAANGTAQCQTGSCSIASCNAGFANCNGQLSDGCEANTNTSTTHCGGCNQACNPAHASGQCLAGACAVGACVPGWVNLNGLPADGCEYACTVSNGGVELCDGRDNNCNGATDEGFNLSGDVNNCGGCGTVCSAPFVTVSACTTGTCSAAICAAGRANCDGQYPNGCEVDVSTSLSNCGGCGVVCSTPNASPVCSNGGCGIGSCNGTFKNCNGTVSDGCEVDVNQNVDACGACGNVCPSAANATRTCSGTTCGFACAPGYVDLDGNAATGCEYQCSPSGVDEPDDGSVDQDCDGIDGTVSKGVFVSPGGSDTNPGTRAAPKRTIQAAINAASVVQSHVYVAGGTYSESVTLRAGVSVYGGYNASNWSRNAANVVTIQNGTINSGRIVGVSATGITSATTVAYVTVRALSTTSTGVSVYGVYCDSCSMLTLRNSIVIAESAGAGGSGANGGDGTPGSSGFGGQAGTCDGNNPGAPGGAGGTSGCGSFGGAGGRGGNYGSNAGVAGSAGYGISIGGPAGGGGDPGRRGTDGSTGAAGARGASGGGGGGGSVVAGFFVTLGGGAGGLGALGNGGGGGGGGGGQGGTFVNDGNGNGGGGGGAGGCPGSGGSGGSGGGSSFGLFLLNSTGIVLTSNSISSASGGAGGAGGNGGNGGGGGTRGFGATTCTGEVGAGGNGGDGGAGGPGGFGGGGAGGWSYAVFRSGTAVTVSGNTLTAGSAGFGGASSGSVGANGSAGTVN